MITFAKIKGSFLEKKNRVLKVFQFGAKTVDEVCPFGVDSNPINGLTAVMAETSTSDSPILLGYIQENRKAEKGEIRIYSVDSNGNEKNFIHVKNNGDILIGGHDYHAVRYEPLKNSIDMKDNLLNVELGKIATALSTVGGTYIPGNVQTTLTSSKSDKVKVG